MFWMFSHMLLLYIPLMSWLRLFFGVNIHMLSICKYLLTCIYVYYLQKKKKKNPKKSKKIPKKFQNAKYSISSQKDNVWNKLKWGTIFE